MFKSVSVLLLSAAAWGAPSAMAAELTSASAPGRSDRPFVIESEAIRCTHQLDGDVLMRTELVFGLSRATGPDITESEFQGFVDDQVTPRFPEGLTLLSGNGQFKDSSGTIVQEKSKVLVLLYPFSRKRSALVEEIRTEYKATFQQQSVLRIDEGSCVSF